MTTDDHDNDVRMAILESLAYLRARLRVYEQEKHKILRLGVPIGILLDNVWSCPSPGNLAELSAGIDKHLRSDQHDPVPRSALMQELVNEMRSCLQKSGLPSTSSPGSEPL